MCLLCVQATANLGSYSSAMQYNCLSRYAKANIGTSTGAASCPAPTDFLEGSASYFYNSTSFYDDLLWTAAWMYKPTGAITPQHYHMCKGVT